MWIQKVSRIFQQINILMKNASWKHVFSNLHPNWTTYFFVWSCNSTSAEVKYFSPEGISVASGGIGKRHFLTIRNTKISNLNAVRGGECPPFRLVSSTLHYCFTHRFLFQTYNIAINDKHVNFFQFKKRYSIVQIHFEQEPLIDRSVSKYF